MAFKGIAIRLPDEYIKELDSIRGKDSRGFMLQQIMYGSGNDNLPPPRKRDTKPRNQEGQIMVDPKEKEKFKKALLKGRTAEEALDICAEKFIQQRDMRMETDQKAKQLNDFVKEVMGRNDT